MKENRPTVGGDQTVSKSKQQAEKSTAKSDTTPLKIIQTSVERSDNPSTPEGKAPSKVKIEPVRFILSGHRFQRKEFQKVIKRLKGKCCRDSHDWSYQATHFISPDRVGRTEKFFAAVASGRWILQSDYLEASDKEGFWKKNLMNGTRMALVKMVTSIWRHQGRSGGSALERENRPWCFPRNAHYHIWRMYCTTFGYSEACHEGW